MQKLIKREFEIASSEGCVIIVCTSSFDKNCAKCINELENSDIKKKFPFVKMYEYDVSTDFDKLEQYNIIQFPKILIFKGGKLYKNYNYMTAQDVLNSIKFTSEEYMLFNH